MESHITISVIHMLYFVNEPGHQIFEIAAIKKKKVYKFVSIKI